MFEAKFLQVEAVDEGVDEPDRVPFVNVLVECIGGEYGLFSVGAVYVFAYSCCSLLLSPISSAASSHGSFVMTR